MKKKLLYILWALLYILCVGLGTFEEPQGLLKAALIGIALCFFLPGGILLYDAIAAGNCRGIRTVRCISIASLVLTLAALVALILAGTGDGSAIDTLYTVLLMVSAPMLCGQYWFISMFFWSLLLSASFLKPRANRR